MIVNILKFFGLLGIAGVVIALMLPPVTRGREAARRTQCKNNLKQIMLALHNYEQEHGAFPPAYTVDGDGRPLHSWRTLILPYLEQRKLYDSIDLLKPWDDPVNADAYRTVVTSYVCPTNSSFTTLTTYLGIVTPGSCLLPAEPRRLGEISDGTANTFVVFEVTPDQGVHWMQPTDADEKKVLNFALIERQPHHNGTHAALADGSIRFIGKQTDQKTLQGLISCDAGDFVGEY